MRPRAYASKKDKKVGCYVDLSTFIRLKTKSKEIDRPVSWIMRQALTTLLSDSTTPNITIIKQEEG